MAVSIASAKEIEANEMVSNDQDKIRIAREYFMRADQGRPDILELFHEGLGGFHGVCLFLDGASSCRFFSS